MKKIEKKIKDYLIKLYPLNKLYFFLKILKKSKKRYHYADNGEDIIIQGLFNHKKDGYYIDVGCYHPIRASLTHLLYKKGWKGVNIDISEDTINLFNIARPNDKNINIGIADKEGEDFYYQSSHINQANSFKFYDNVKKIKVKITTLDNIIKNLGIEKIDVRLISNAIHFVNESEIFSWPLVKNKTCSVKDARKIFNFFLHKSKFI